MTRAQRNSLLVGLATACGLLLLPLLGIAVGFGICGKSGAMWCLGLICVALILCAGLCIINVRCTRQ
mgnify:CR=1 FL=1